MGFNPTYKHELSGGSDQQVNISLDNDIFRGNSTCSSKGKTHLVLPTKHLVFTLKRG